jgi:putative ABC transport system permease protein
VITADFTIFEESEALIGSVSIVIVLLVMMAIIIAAVGGISLSGVLSINVLERRREIGVLRAIGASSAAIATLFITEGLIMGWISWFLALAISTLASQLMADAVAGALDTTIIYRYSTSGIWYWLIIITIMSALASWLPARGAISVSVRESLAYD